METPTPTQAKILESAKRHFLTNGFRGASLRRIVADAGFTLGAFYGYYDSKETLFDALVAETADGIVRIVSGMGDRADRIPREKQMDSMNAVFAEGLPELLDYLLARRDETYLLLKCSEGTKYHGFLDALARRDLDFVKGFSGGRFPLHPLAAQLLVGSYYELLGDAVLSGAPREEVRQAMLEIQDMFAGGMIYLLKGTSE